MADSSVGKQAEKKVKDWLDRPEEEWRPVVSYGGIYENRYVVSNLGRVLSFAKDPPYMLKIHSFSSGYKYVVLSASPNTNNALVHRLVAEAFLDNPQNKRCINHIDGDKGNNRLHNLEWVTDKENTHHAINKGLMKCSDVEHMRRMAQSRSKQITKEIKCLNNGCVYSSIKECSKELNINLSYLYSKFGKGVKDACVNGYHIQILKDNWSRSFKVLDN